MTIEFTDGVNGDGLFDIQGKGVHAADTLNTSITSYLDEIEDFFDQYKTKTGTSLDYDAAMSDVAANSQNLIGDGQAQLAQIGQTLADQLIWFVADDAAQPDDTLENALRVLIQQMKDNDTYVTPNVVTATLTADAGNSSTDLTIAYFTKGGNDVSLQNAIAEDLTFELEDAGDTFLQVNGEEAVDKLAHNWPQGSGADTTIAFEDDTVISSGSFQDATYADAPDDWIVAVGTIGTDWLLTDPEIQTLTVTGSPTAGFYFITWESPDGITHTSEAIAYNGDGAAVQAALRGIPGFESVEVSTTGTSPNYVHEITLTGVAGNVNTIAVINHTTGGTLTPAVDTAGEDGAWAGRSLQCVSDGSTVNTIYLPIDGLQPDTMYAFHARMRRNSAASSGTVIVDFVDGIGGTVLQSSESDNQNDTTTITDLSTSTHTAVWFGARFAATIPSRVYLRIRWGTVPPNTGVVWMDDIILREATELYPGGPLAAAFAGKVAPAKGDKWTLAIGNNYAGEWQNWYNRFFEMDALQLVLPFSGTTLINNSLIG